MSENESLIKSKNTIKNNQPSAESTEGADELDVDFASIKESRDKQNRQDSVVHPGLYLRKAREDRDITRGEIALKMKLNVELIEALENGDEDVLPGSVFTSGYIRSYAKLVDLSPSAMVGEYQRFTSQKNAKKVVKLERPAIPPLPGIVDNLKEYLSSLSFISDPSPEAKSARYAAAGVVVVVMLVAILVIFGTPDSEPTLPNVSDSDLGPIDKTITVPMAKPSKRQGKISLDTVGGDGVPAKQSSSKADIQAKSQIKTPPVKPNTEANIQSAAPEISQANINQKSTQSVNKSTSEQGSAASDQASEKPVTEASVTKIKNVLAQITPAGNGTSSISSGKAYLIKPLDAGQTSVSASGTGSVAKDALVSYVTLTVRYEAESWVDIRDATGKRLIGNVGKANTEKEVTGTPPFKILIGFSPGVTIEYNGVPVDFSSQQIRSVARFTLAAAPTE